MKINIKLIATLNLGRSENETRNYPNKTSVKQILEDIDLQEKSVGVILINGKHASLDDLVEEEDTLFLLPLMDGG